MWVCGDNAVMCSVDKLLLEKKVIGFCMGFMYPPGLWVRVHMGMGTGQRPMTCTICGNPWPPAAGRQHPTILVLKYHYVNNITITKFSI